MAVQERPVVVTGSGSVRGVVEGGVAAFRGIPYAASPVGERRFAAPGPHPGWPGVRDAARPGPSVPQGPSRLEAVMGRRAPDWDEDGCLTLNVWSPEPLGLSGPPSEGSAPGGRPVLVWFHGGGFSSGSGGWDWYDGRHLAAAGGLVVVTANYRLGPLGYLHLPELGSDNLGVRDQAAVLAWVRHNIAGFGGDPELLTVGGQSAGAYSALHLALAPETGPWIARVVTQSGPFGLPPQDPGEAADHARRFLGILGLDRRPDPLAALRAVPPGQLLTAYGQLARDVARPGKVAPPMYPVLGGYGLPVTWQQALADGRLDGKQLLTGTTGDEMTAFYAFDPAVRTATAERARAIAATLAEDGAARYDRTAAGVPRPPGDILTEVATGLQFRDRTLAIAAHHAAAGHPTYVYRFDRTPTPDPARLGATHCAELPYLFATFDAYPDSPMLGEATPAARTLGHAFSHAVATFAATGRPPAEHWPPYARADPTTVRHFG
ncbi:carboxylesterase/lipase family protein [Kitasatospora sp. NPDC059827]|uniref:carboxylesterase/lipase family protein n=1 Tax=Kitasatospora sp. NPDC059827 TaxID=3346964 RepID=UPI00364FE869